MFSEFMYFKFYSLLDNIAEPVCMSVFLYSNLLSNCSRHLQISMSDPFLPLSSHTNLQIPFPAASASRQPSSSPGKAPQFSWPTYPNQHWLKPMPKSTRFFPSRPVSRPSNVTSLKNLMSQLWSLTSTPGVASISFSTMQASCTQMMQML